MFGESLLFTFLVIGAKAQNYFEWSNHDGIQVSLERNEDSVTNRGEAGKVAARLRFFYFRSDRNIYFSQQKEEIPHPQ